MKLTISNLSKTYSNGTRAMQDINLEIPAGMFGLLGPNGAGKSTLMRTISTLQEADSGSIFLDGLDVLKEKDEVRRLLGYLPQDFGVYPKESAENMLNHFAVLKGLADNKVRKEAVKGLLQFVNLYDVRHKKLGSFSGGMKQRFGIAQALLGNPKLIIVDEPTAGLDPAERNRFLNLLSEVGENNIVILSTHIVEDVTELCPKMAIIYKGEVLLKAEPLDAIHTLQGKIWEKQIDKEELESYLKMHSVISSKSIMGKSSIHVLADYAPDATFHSIAPNLEDVYFAEIFKKEALNKVSIKEI
jgi:ABC-2 type transport system ATP-binding protein